jgi:hypothetical protein
MSIFPRFVFVLSRFRLFFSDGNSKSLKKTSHRKVFTKKSTTNPKSIFLVLLFGRFSVRGVQKHDKKYHQKKSDPIPFSYSNLPTHHGGHRFVFCRPLVHPRGCVAAAPASSKPKPIQPPQSPPRGAGKSKSTDPPVHLLNPRPTHPPVVFFKRPVLVRFEALLGNGS